jgi:glycosyltransferase involved in cell wall biosynthesis
MPRDRVIIMLGPSAAARGGMSSVLQVYQECGLFSRHPVRFIATTCDPPRWRKLAWGLAAFARYTVALLGGAVVAVHAHVAIGASLWRKGPLAIMAMALRIPVILHLHGGEIVHRYGSPGHPVATRYVRWLLDHATAIVVLSPNWRAPIQRLTTNPRIAVLPNPVPPQPVTQPVTDRPVALEQHPTIVYLGRFSRDKGIYDLLAIYQRLLLRHPGIRMVCAGDGEVESVRECVRAASLDESVEVKNWISPGEKWALLNRSTVCVLPSYFEGLPMVLLEAMAAGVPVVASRTGGIPDLIHDRVNGLLVTPGDIDGFVAAIDAVLCDPRQRRRFIEAGRRTVEADYSAPRVLEQLLGLYAELGVLHR